MFGVLMVTLLITIALVGSNMDTILKQGVVFQVRAEITENPAIAESFASVEEFEAFVQEQIDQRRSHSSHSCLSVLAMALTL